MTSSPETTAPSEVFAPGRVFGRYRIEARVSSGGMGTVYRARDDLIARPVAVKVLSSSATDPSDAGRLLREARLAAKLEHPSIVRVYEAGIEAGIAFIAMEWVEGRTLREIGALPIAARVQILLALAEALAYAHAEGVVHRDVKPANVIVTSGGEPKVVDFGIARRAPNAAGLPDTLTLTHAVAGTPGYMAPEQRATAAVDARVDQYAWGVVAYELLGGVHPYATRSSPADDAAPPDDGGGLVRPLTWLEPEVPEELAAVIHRAMARAPEQRFPSMDRIVAAIRAAFGDVGIGLVPTPPPTLGSPIAVLADRPTQEVAPPPAAIRGPRPAARRRPSGPAEISPAPASPTRGFAMFLGGVAVGLVGVAGLALWLARSPRAAPAVASSTASATASADPLRASSAPREAAPPESAAPSNGPEGESPSGSASPGAGRPARLEVAWRRMDVYLASADAVARAQARARPAVTPCFTPSTLDPDTSITVHLRLASDGRINHVAAASTSPRTPKSVISCVEQRLIRLRMPPLSTAYVGGVVVHLGIRTVR